MENKRAAMSVDMMALPLVALRDQWLADWKDIQWVEWTECVMVGSWADGTADA